MADRRDDVEPEHHITAYSAMIPVQSERICSIQRAWKCARNVMNPVNVYLKHFVY